MSRFGILAAALALSLAAVPALSQGAARPPAGPFWYDGPGTAKPGTSRMRLVFDATRAAALTPEQYWTYSGIYKRQLAALAFRMPVSAAVPQARAAALTEVAARFAAIRVEAISLTPVGVPRYAPRL